MKNAFDLFRVSAPLLYEHDMNNDVIYENTVQTYTVRKSNV